MKIIIFQDRNIRWPAYEKKKKKKKKKGIICTQYASIIYYSNLYITPQTHAPRFRNGVIYPTNLSKKK